MPAIVLDEWIDLGQIRCRSITARAKREAESEDLDMPLNSASYDVSRDAIFAVRSGYILRYDGTTGAAQACARYTTVNIGDESYCWYDSGTDSVWANVWRGTQNLNEVSSGRPAAFVQIDPDTLAVTNTFNIAADVSQDGNQWWTGPRQVVVDGTNIYCSTVAATVGYNRLFCFDITNIAFGFQASASPFSSARWANYDITNGFLYYCDSSVRRVKEMNKLTLSDTGNNTALIVAGRFIYGSCWSPSNSRIYACTKTRFVHKLEVGGAQADLAIDTGQASATPHNIRYNSVDGLVYVPLYADDTVAVISPADDSVVIKTGFDSPWDCVFSATKKWALQHGPIGLKEIV